jgi:cell division septal protein FtsQ
MTRRGLPVGPPPEDLVDLPLDPTADESPFLRPRRRTPIRPRRRGFSGRAIVAVQIAAVALLGVVGAWTAWQRVFASDRLRVGRLEVRGSHFLSEGEVREMMGPAVGESILALDIEALKARLRASPWVADATVTRALPDTVRVEIHERVPLALAELDHLYLMDQDGGLIDIYGPRTGAFDLPIVRGLSAVEESSRRERARRAGALLADLGELGAEISEVFVEPSGDLRVVLRGAGEVLLFGDPPYRTRLVTFLSLRRELAERAPGAEHFDLRFRGRIFAKQPKSVTPSEPGAAPSHPAAETRDRRARAVTPLPPPADRAHARTSEARIRRQLLAKKKDRYIVGLDVGTHKICAIVAELTDEGRLDVIGIGQTESKGLRKGVVINLEATVDAIKRVLEEAELMAGVEIDSVYVGIAGTHIKGFNSRGVIAVSSKNRSIDREDVRRVIDAAKAVSIPIDREILHVLPQEFVVDDQDGIGDPSGMTGTRLEVNVHVITCSTTAAQNTVTCVNRAGLEVVDTVLTQLAAVRGLPDARREGARRRDRRHRRRHHRPRDLREGLALAHRGAAGGRRALHERRGGRAAHARQRGREDQEEARLRAHLDDPGRGLDRGAERRRQQAPHHGAPGAGRRAAGARGGDLPAGAHRDPPRGLRAQPQQRRRAHRRRRDPRGAARDRGADLRHAGPARNADRHRRARRRGGEPGLRDGGRTRAVWLPQPRRTRARRGPSGGDGDIRQGHLGVSWAGCRTFSEGGEMETKREGAALPPLPVTDPRVTRARRGPFPMSDAGELPCEMCGAAVVAYHCKRICLHCGFMTGCSEGI